MEEVFSVFANCIPVKGFRRSIIYDLTRSNYHFIPNSMYEILQNFNGKTVKEVKSFYKDYDDIIDDYFVFLLENDYIFFCDKEELEFFPKLNYYWEVPYDISNCIIEIEEGGEFDLTSLVANLKDLKCNHIHLYFRSGIYGFDKLQRIIKKINTYFFKSVKISVCYSQGFEDLDKLIELCKNNLNITEINFYESDKKENTKIEGLLTSFSFTKDNKYDKEIKSLTDFYVNMDLFMESQFHNTFFNKKLIISSLGFFTNSIGKGRKKWDLKSNNLRDIIFSEEFRENWGVKKDYIEICKDCEFRYMCVDKRVPLKVKDSNYWSFETKCSYDPFRAKWNL